MTDEETPAFVRVRGLYSPSRTYKDATADEARRAFHDEFPGLQGTILKVEVLESLEEGKKAK
jgi:hypothetical protein